MSNIFTPRATFKPFEYPEAIKYKDAIRHSYWLGTEWSYVSDVQDFTVKLNDIERSAIKNALLAISQIEVSVKKFWRNLGDRFPKSEFESVGTTFAESEVRHADAYSDLLEKLNLNADYSLILQNPVIQGRVDYLTKYLKGASASSDQNFTMNLALFSIFIEYVSLFSQFAVIKSFNKHKNVLKDVDNVISATFREENIHGLFGMYMINQIREENPDWFNEDFYNKIYRAAKKAYQAEEKIIDWILESGEPDFLTKTSIKEFVKYRLNESIVMIGGNPVFEVDQAQLSELDWFLDEVVGEISVDFFYKKSTEYSKKVQSIKAEDLF